MEIIQDFVNNQFFLYIPVLVIVVAILVFTFGFKSPEQPAFDKLIGDERKQAGVAKRKKIKDKKTAVNGHVSTGDNKTEKLPLKDSKRSPSKETPEASKLKEKKSENNRVVAEKNKKNEAIKTKTVEDTKNKKNIKKQISEKPVDFDDGNWETVPSKADKKKKAEQSPVKKEKKVKRIEDSVEIGKLVKEVVNKELRKKEKEKNNEVVRKVEVNVNKIEEIAVVAVEEKKEKKKEKKVKVEEEKVEKVQEKIVSPPPVVQKEVINEKVKPAVAADGNVAFDELGDVWTEAKAQKKSKKKTRRDN